MNNKTIGILLIVVGIVFIALGVWSSMPKVTTQTPSIYKEQNNNNEVNNVTDTIDVNVYTETDEQESTRYIY